MVVGCVSFPTDSELPAFTSALSPSANAWAWAGRGSKLAIRSIDTSALEATETEEESQPGPSVLGGSGNLIDTAKGKFGMSVEFVSRSTTSLTAVTRRQAGGSRFRDGSRCGRGRRDLGSGRDILGSRNGGARTLLEPR